MSQVEKNKNERMNIFWIQVTQWQWTDWQVFFPFKPLLSLWEAMQFGHMTMNT